MSSKSDRPLKIELTIQAENPQLLEGLDLWLRLGLISNAQVKHICQAHLVCSLPKFTSQEPGVSTGGFTQDIGGKTGLLINPPVPTSGVRSREL